MQTMKQPATNARAIPKNENSASKQKKRKQKSASNINLQQSIGQPQQQLTDRLSPRAHC
jgi:hypothetical protein